MKGLIILLAACGSPSSSEPDAPVSSPRAATAVVPAGPLEVQSLGL